MRWLTMIVMLFSLAGCDLASGGKVSERIDRPRSEIVSALTRVSVADVAGFFPGMTFQRSQPDADSMKFVVPGSNSHTTTILFHFTPLDGGKATQVDATLDVPAVVSTIDGKKKVLTQARVASELRRVLRRLGNGSGSEAATEGMSQLVIALAISTNDAYRDKAMALRDDPAAALADLMGDADDGTQAGAGEALAAADQNDPTDFDRPRDDSDQFAPEDDGGDTGAAGDQ